MAGGGGSEKLPTLLFRGASVAQGVPGALPTPCAVAARTGQAAAQCRHPSRPRSAAAPAAPRSAPPRVAAVSCSARLPPRPRPGTSQSPCPFRARSSLRGRQMGGWRELEDSLGSSNAVAALLQVQQNRAPTPPARHIEPASQQAGGCPRTCKWHCTRSVSRPSRQHPHPVRRPWPLPPGQ